MSQLEKLDLRFCKTKQKHFWFAVTHLILMSTIVQNKLQQTNKTKINHINDNFIEFSFLSQGTDSHR